MKRFLSIATLALLFGLLGRGDLDGRGFGGFGGGFRSESFGGFRSDLGGSYSGFRSTDAYSGWRGGYGGATSFDRSWETARGGSLDTSGTRGAIVLPSSAAIGGSRDTSITTAGGRTYGGSRSGGVAVGPYGRVVGGGSRAGVATGPRGVVAGGEHTAFAGARLPTDLGLSHYAFGGAGVGHSTAYWSHGVMATRAGYVRTGFGYYNSFRPAWYTAHPGCWYPSRWAPAYAWRFYPWPVIASFCFIPRPPVYYDYGTTIVYENNNVYVNGTDAGTAVDYAQQATTIADAGQKADTPTTVEWKPLGVFALVQGDEKTSNNIFQIAVNKDGIIRGNYYDGLMDTTSPIYGSVDPKTQRAAWTIGKKNDRVFETGIYNLTKAETPILVHFGTTRTQQWLLVRVEEPKSGATE